jgi:hypothetical protein
VAALFPANRFDPLRLIEVADCTEITDVKTDQYSRKEKDVEVKPS